MAGKSVVFLCGKCRKKVLSVRLGRKRVVIVSPFKETTLFGKRARRIGNAVKDRDLFALNHFYALDCFCPECGKVYCESHLKSKINFESGGWYDDMDVSCPKKHTWTVD